MSTKSVQPDHGAYGDSWPDNFAVPRSLSTGGWTVQSPGFDQQTFPELFPGQLTAKQASLG